VGGLRFTTIFSLEKDCSSSEFDVGAGGNQRGEVISRNKNTPGNICRPSKARDEDGEKCGRRATKQKEEESLPLIGTGLEEGRKHPGTLPSRPNGEAGSRKGSR